MQQIQRANRIIEKLVRAIITIAPARAHEQVIHN